MCTPAAPRRVAVIGCAVERPAVVHLQLAYSQREAVLVCVQSGFEATPTGVVFFDDELDGITVDVLSVPEHGVARHVGRQTAGERDGSARLEGQIPGLNGHRDGSQTCIGQEGALSLVIHSHTKKDGIQYKPVSPMYY